MSLAPGSRIGSYEVRSSIGAGGMGEVYMFVKTLAQDRVRPSFSVVTDWFEEVRARMRTAAQP